MDRPPRKELLRNILLYTVEVRSKNSAAFTTIDSIPGVINFPAYIFPRFPFYYRSKPVFSYNTDYTLRVSVHYRSGNVKTSNQFSFITPLERGKVLRRLPLPLKVPYDTYWFGNLLAFHKGKLLVLRDEQLFQVDTSTGNATLLKNNFLPPPDYPNRTFRSMAVCGDTLIAPYDTWSAQAHTLVRLDFITLRVDSTLDIPSQGKFIQSMTGQDSLIHLLWGLPPGRQQIAVVNLRTRKTLRTFPDVPARILYPYAMCFDGINFWTAENLSFDNKIVRFDPSSLTILEQHRNPIFSPEGLTFDGKYFWTIDRDTQTIVKLQLEGM